MQDYPETHQQGFMIIENLPDDLWQILKDNCKITGKPYVGYNCDLGVQIGTDGRIWLMH